VQKMFDIYNPYSNTDVTTTYIEVIIKALANIGFATRNIDKIERNNKGNIVVISVIDSIKAKMCGYRTIILWLQGIIPEESFQRNHSNFRKKVLSMIEKEGIKCASFKLYVSDYMRRFYNDKYGFHDSNYYIMPCFNEEINPLAIKNKSYKKNTFVYAGSTETWQCFEETLEYYKMIEDIVDDASLKIMVKNKEYAESLVKKYNIRNYSIIYVTKDLVAKELSSCKFGFCLRQNNEVNNVATPTKLSSYISNGVFPIYSSCIYDFDQIAASSKFCYRVEKSHNRFRLNKKIIEAAFTEYRAIDVLNDYESTFGKYYSFSNHVKKLSEKLPYYIKTDIK